MIIINLWNQKQKMAEMLIRQADALNASASVIMGLTNAQFLELLSGTLIRDDTG